MGINFTAQIVAPNLRSFITQRVRKLLWMKPAMAKLSIDEVLGLGLLTLIDSECGLDKIVLNCRNSACSNRNNARGFIYIDWLNLQVCGLLDLGFLWGGENLHDSLLTSGSFCNSLSLSIKIYQKLLASSQINELNTQLIFSENVSLSYKHVILIKLLI